MNRPGPGGGAGGRSAWSTTEMRSRPNKLFQGSSPFLQFVNVLALVRSVPKPSYSTSSRSSNFDRTLRLANFVRAYRPWATALWSPNPNL